MFCPTALTNTFLFNFYLTRFDKTTPIHIPFYGADAKTRHDWVPFRSVFACGIILGLTNNVYVDKMLEFCSIKQEEIKKHGQASVKGRPLRVQSGYHLLGRQADNKAREEARDAQIAKALQYIRRHATANIRVADILTVVTLSRRTLEKRFKQWLGHTPHEEIQRVRMNRIMDLLAETELSVHEIASRAGFEHNEYMAAAFKRETGVTPTEYREKARDA